MTRPILEARHCAWCEVEIPPWKRSTARTCSKKCRQSLNRFRVNPASATAASPMRFGYADPPYPKKARRYYKADDVDHHALVLRLAETYPAGWALSTGADSLVYVLDLVLWVIGEEVAARDVRVCPWFRGSRPCVSMRPPCAWEPLIVFGGRRRNRGPGEGPDDALILHANARHISMPGYIIGQKPPGFSEWMFGQLGALKGDTLDDLFPGSGAVSRAWKMFNR